MIWWLCSLAVAGPMHLVMPGDTVQSLAGGDDARAEAIRALNDVSGPLPIGGLVELPDADGYFANQAAFLIKSVGTVTATEVGQPPRPLSIHEPVAVGTDVCTGEGSSATVRLATQCNASGADGDDVVLGASTCVRVEHVYADTDERSTVVRVLSGAVQVLDNDAAGNIAVITEAGVTTGEGGGFRVTVEDEAARTEALFAPVSVAAEGATVQLTAGQGSRTKVGEAPGAAVDLLAPGVPTSPGAGDVLARPHFEWTPVDKALGYRVEFAADGDFTEVLQSEDVEGTPYSPPVFMLLWPSSGELFWRVASLDRLGFLGIPSEPRPMRLPRGVQR